MPIPYDRNTPVELYVRMLVAPRTHNDQVSREDASVSVACAVRTALNRGAIF